MDNHDNQQTNPTDTVDNLETQVSDTNTVQPNGDSPATTLLNLESLINRHVSMIEKLKEDLKHQKQMHDDAFENDKTYKENSEKVKEVNKAVVEAKQQIAKQPAIIELSMKIKDMREEIKEMEKALSDYLQEYQRVSGTNQIQCGDGEIREIINTAKLAKKSSKPKD